MNSGSTPEHLQSWFHAKPGEVHRRVFEHVRKVEREQWNTFDRFLKLEHYYDPNCLNGDGTAEALGLVTENVVASNVDTVAAVVAATDVRTRYQTDGGDWSVQRQARHLEWYSEGLATLLERHKKCHAAFKETAKKGTGFVFVYVDRFDQIKVEHVLVDDVVVNERECRSGGASAARQLHRRTIVDREELLAEYPDKAVEIDRAQKTGSWSKWADYRPLEPTDLVKLESWKLPFGLEGKEGYMSGRHTVTIDGCDLLDEPWDKPFFPCVRMAWSERKGGYYGISLTERIAGHQAGLNKMNWQVDRQLDQLAVPTTYLRPADAAATTRSTKAGNFCVIRGDYPQTVIPNAVSGEVYKRMETLKGGSYEETGVSRMAASATKPAGIDSGVGLREYRDQTTQRFAPQEKIFEEANLQVDWLILDCCKDLGKKAPVISKRSKFGEKRIKWSEVDMGDTRISMAAASTMSRTPAGRAQLVLELAQAGVISQDETRRLMGHPDIEEAMSLYTAAIENIEHSFEEIADGNIVMPEPTGTAGTWLDAAS